MIILVGPSASGKTYIGKELEKKNFLKVVTYTTREKRNGEIDGVDYHFLNIEEFKRLKANNYFFETVLYNNNYYGTAFNTITSNSYLIVEPSGLLKYQKLNNVISFYIDVDLETRKLRMKQRGDSEKQIKERLLKDETIFNNDIKKQVNYILDGKLDASLNAKIIEEKVNGLSKN